jgi:anti-sigma-K factor RskA
MPLNDAELDLLVKQVLEGSSPEEAAQLRALGTAAEAQRLGLEQAAAAACIALAGEPRTLPSELRRRLQSGAHRFSASRQPAAIRRRPQIRSLWWAAAACLLLAAVILWRSPIARDPSLQAARNALLANASTLKISWTVTKDPGAAGVGGDVVWDPVSQRGYLRFVGMPKNDPARHQYQLWIFDAQRDARYPVDGGVFDVVNAGAEVIIPIRAALPVRDPKLFAVTIERPGGVVVSDREHIVLTAQAG